MRRRGLEDGVLVHVTSRRGSIVVLAHAGDGIGPVQAFVAMLWGSEFLGGSSSRGDAQAGVNALTTSAYCPTSKQPELKHAAVKILKAELPWSLLGMAWLPADEALHTREELRRLMRAFPFASCGRGDASRNPAGRFGRRGAALCRPPQRPEPRDAAGAPRRRRAPGGFRA